MEFTTGLILLSQLINAGFAYDCYKYFPKKEFSDVNNVAYKPNITYRPENIFTLNLLYEGSWLEINWQNSFRGKVFVSPTENEQLGSSLMATLDVHVKLYETFYLHSRVNNLYNVEYSYRDGYPEPGIQFFLGLRIII
jgi:outer membrane cobalamin receptor